MLEATDVDNSPAQLTYIVDVATVNGTLRLSGTALGVSDTFTQADINAGLVTYDHDGTETVADAFAFTLDDGVGTTVSSSFNLTIGATNDAPVAATIEGTALTYTENDGAVAITSTITFTDVDDTNVESALVRFTSGYNNAEDLLSFTDQSGITGLWNGATGELTLTGSATLAEYETAVRSITYANSSENPDTTTRTISFTVNDGDTDSNTLTRDIAVSRVNDDPWNAGGLPASVTVVEDVIANVDFSAIDVQDVDGATANLTLTFTTGSGGTLAAVSGGGVVVTGSGTGAMALTGTQAALNAFLDNATSIQFTSAPNASGLGSDSISLSLTDNGNFGSGGGGDISLGSVSVDITAVNDGPVLVNNQLTIVEDATVLLTTANLSATDIDGDPLSYTATNITGGQFERVGTPGIAITSFTAVDVASGNVMFVHDGNEAAPTYEITVSDGALTDGPHAATITFTNVNDSPVLVTNLGAATSEGGTVMINAGILNATDVDNAQAQIRFTIDTAPANGTLFLGGTALGLGDSFTQADIDAGMVSYVHDHSNTTTDSFDFSIDDGAGGNVPTQSFALSITPIDDDAAVETTNTGSVAAEGASDTITASELSFTDTEQPATALTFSLASGPAHGHLELASNPGVVVNSFTQADIDAGLVTYVSNGDEVVMDSFTFSVDDGQGNVTTTRNFDLTITPVNDEQVIATNTDAVVSEGGLVVLTTANLNTTDVDNTPAELVYTVTGTTAHGTLTLNGTALGLSDSFTQADIDTGRVSYQHDGSETSADLFTFQVDDGQGSASTGSYHFNVTPVNDAPTLDLDADNSSGQAGANYGTTYTEDAPGIAVVDTDATLTDVDSGTLVGLSAQITNLIDVGAERLVADTTGTSITAAYNGLTGVLTLSGTDSVANYEQVLRTISYENTSQLPTTVDRMITFSANDGSDLSNVGTTTVSIVSVNDAPTIANPATATVNEDGTLTFSTANGNAISISDLEAGNNALEVTLSVANGTLNLGSTAGLTFTVGSGVNDTAMTFRGTAAAINAALDGLQFTPITDFNGAVVLNLFVSDLGNVGAGGPQTGTSQVAITVEAVNDTPIATGNAYTTAEDTELTGNLITDDRRSRRGQRH